MAWGHSTHWMFSKITVRPPTKNIAEREPSYATGFGHTMQYGHGNVGFPAFRSAVASSINVSSSHLVSVPARPRFHGSHVGRCGPVFEWARQGSRRQPLTRTDLLDVRRLH